jgi:molecular chaperone DnaJ
MANKDYYATLGVDRDADDAALKSAYRKLAMQYHPDRNPGDAKAEAKFKEINEAYDVLKDGQKRAAYDRFGPEAFQQGGGGAGPFGGGGAGFEGNFEDLFEDLMGGLFGGGGFGASGGPRTTRSRTARGSDLRYNLEVTLAQAYAGTKAQISFPTTVPCATCDGSGAKPGSKPITCGTCQGNGTVFMRQGFFQMSRTCPDCGGNGQVIKDKCKDCHGAGRVRKTKTLDVTIPVGVDTGTRLRLASEGEAGTAGGPAGDLFVFVQVAKHPVFGRDGANLLVDLPVSALDAMLGTELSLPMLDGSQTTVKVPAGTQPGDVLRLHGLGMPNLGRARDKGDLLVKVQVEIPTQLSKTQRENLETLRNELAMGRKQRGFMDNLKKLFK